MKTYLKVFALALTVVICALCFGCNKEQKDFAVNSKKTYYQYYFNTDSEKFEKIPNAYQFNADGTFTFMYGGEDKSLDGTWSASDGNYVEMKYNVSDNDEIIRTIIDKLGTSTQLTQSDILTLVSQIDFDETLFSYKNCVFSASNVQAYKFISSDNAKPETTDEVEGVYVVKSFDYLLYVSNGDIYSQDEENPQDNKYPLYRGSYKVVGDFIFIEFKNSKNEAALATAVYYIGMIKLPDDLTADENDDETMKYLTKWSGMKVRCWTNTVYSTETIG